MTGLEVLYRELALPGNWQLGSGQRTIWAPQSPRHLDRPGFRDPGTYMGHPIDPVFAVSILDERATPLPMRAFERNWNPARLELKYRLPEALITERRSLLSCDTFISQWTITHSANISQYYWLVLWTRRPDGIGERRIGDIEANPRGVSFQESVVDSEGGEQNKWGCALGANFDADSWSVNGAESPGVDVTWNSTPFLDLMAPGGLPGHLPQHESADGHLFFALAYPFEVPAGERLIVNFAAAFAPDVELARGNLERGLSIPNPIQAAEEEWINYFEEVPSFTCSDAKIQRAYWNRWAQRRIWPSILAAHSTTPAAADAPSDLPDSIGDEVACLIENAWRATAEELSAGLRRLVNSEDRSVASQPLALAAKRILSLHRDSELKTEICNLLGEFFEKNHATPAELPKTIPAEPWRRESDEPMNSLAKSVFMYDIARLLDKKAENETAKSKEWEAKARTLAEQIEQEFWNEASRFYVEYPVRGKQGAAVKTAMGFLPLLAGLVDHRRATSLQDSLYDPERFWTNYGVPSLSRDDADFNPDGRWRSHRLDYPCHGRIWPALNSLVIESVGRLIENATMPERILVAELIVRAIELTFVDGDANHPQSHWHYNPLNGKPAAFLDRFAPKGGWNIDHILRYIAGIRPSEDGKLLIDPLPSRLEWFSVERVYLGEHELSVDWDHRTGLSVKMDEESVGHAPVGKALLIAFPEVWALDQA